MALSPARRRLPAAARRRLSEERPLRFGPRHLCRRDRARSGERPRRPQRRPDPDRAGPPGRRGRACSTRSPAARPPPMSASPMRWPASPSAPIEMLESAARSPIGDAAHPPESRACLCLRRRLAPRPRDRRAGHLARRSRRAHGAMGRLRAPRRRPAQVASLLGVAPGRGSGPAGPARARRPPAGAAQAVPTRSPASAERRRAPSSRRRSRRRSESPPPRRRPPRRRPSGCRRPDLPARGVAEAPARAARPRPVAAPQPGRPRRAARPAEAGVERPPHAGARRTAPRRKPGPAAARRRAARLRTRAGRRPRSGRAAPRRSSAPPPVAAAPRRSPAPRPVRSGNAPVVVQLGAFSNEANAERAWLQPSRRYGLAGRRAADHHVQS